MKKKKIVTPEELQAAAMVAQRAKELADQKLSISQSIWDYYQVTTLKKSISPRLLNRLAFVAINYGADIAFECIDICFYKFGNDEGRIDTETWSRYISGIINTKRANGELS